MRRGLIFLTGLFLSSGQLSASCLDSFQQDKDSLIVFFKAGHSAIDLSLVDNAGQLSSMKHKVTQLCKNNQLSDYWVTIYSGASPEGGDMLNDGLAASRAEVIAKELVRDTPLNRDNIRMHVRGVDWESLTLMVEDSSMPYKEEMLSILRNTPVKVSEGGTIRYARKESVKNLANGYPYKWMYNHLFRRLRYASVVIGPREDPQPAVVHDTIPAEVEMTPLVVAEPEKRESNLTIALKTNAVYDAMALPNIGMEIYLKNNWSLTGNWMYSWWKNDKKSRYWRIYGGDLGARKYLGSIAEERRLSGHHVGFFVQGLSYDVEFGAKGYLTRHWNYGASFEYGFSLPIAKRVNFDFSLGLGYFGGENKKYRPERVNGEKKYIWKDDNHFNWVGPTKVEASLVILLGKINNK